MGGCVTKEVDEVEVESRVVSRGAREEGGDTAAFHVLGSFLGGSNTLLHGGRVLGATVSDCVTHRVATLTSGRFGRTLRCARSRGCRLRLVLRFEVEDGVSLEVVKSSFESIDTIATDVEH